MNAGSAPSVLAGYTKKGTITARGVRWIAHEGRPDLSMSEVTIVPASNGQHDVSIRLVVLGEAVTRFLDGVERTVEQAVVPGCRTAMVQVKRH